jgi:hypothetical protein
MFQDRSLLRSRFLLRMRNAKKLGRACATPKRSLAAEAGMGYYVRRLKRPYDYRVLIEAYIYTQRTDFINRPTYTTYYASLLEALERQYGIRMSTEGLAFPQKVLWMLFQSTVRSLLRITNPWADFLDETLLVKKLEENSKVDPILWTKNERSFATPVQVCLTRNLVIALVSSTPLRYPLRAG